MQEKCYNITFGGKVAQGHNIEEVKRNLAIIFKLDDGKIEQFFTGKKLMIKKNITYQLAMQYKTAFEKAGAICGVAECEVTDSKDSPQVNESKAMLPPHERITSEPKVRKKGENIESEPQELASRWHRLGGALLDVLIMMIITVPVMMATGIFSQISQGQQMSIGQGVFFLIFGFVVFLILHGYLLSKHGQTIGKRVMGTRIVDLNGQIVPFAKVFLLRYFVIGVIAQTPIIGNLLGLVNALFIFRKNKRCIHDLMAGTKVVNA
jgi:uncharacterized RDD family membrane protein YckC